MGWFKWKKPAAPRIERQVYVVQLLHDYGHDVELPNVSEENLRFIRENLGRDQIYLQEAVTVNLRSFSFAKHKVQKEKQPTEEA